MFFIGQNLKHVDLTYFIQLLIFFWLTLVDIHWIEIISHYIKEILYVNKKFKGE